MSVATPRAFALGPYLETERAAVNAALERRLDELLDGVSSDVADPVRYAIAAGGKRIRPILCLAAFRAVARESEGHSLPDGIYDLATALELIHTYSLVHDDLPCMDDDDLRRGRPTTHRVYGVAAAACAGAALIALAGRLAARGGERVGLDAGARAAMLADLFTAAGTDGMVGGQWLDLEAEGQGLDAAELARLHAAKTGALLAASVRLGARAAGADAPVLDAVGEFGRRIGLAFQIADDVLDATASSAALGKTAGKDAAAAKSTYVALLGVEPARVRAAEEAAAAVAALARAGIASPELSGLARYAVERSN